MAHAYRDDEKAALVAAVRLRDENRELRSKVDDLQRQAKAAADPVVLAATTSDGSGWLRISLFGAVVAILLLTGAALWLGRATASVGGTPAVGVPDRPFVNQASQPPSFNIPPSAGNTFDRYQVTAALGRVAGELSMCATTGGPTGTGHVKLTFERDGTVSSAEVDEPPFAGTAVGECVAHKFSQARIPAFFGGQVKVGKYFSIGSR